MEKGERGKQVRVCDNCAALLKENDGYVFYSAARLEMEDASGHHKRPPIGTMLICEKCTDKACSNENFIQTPPGSRELTPDDLANPSTIFEMMQAANLASIAEVLQGSQTLAC